MVSQVNPDTVKAMRPFVPAQDFKKSQAFYRDLGFREEELAPGLSELYLGPYSFILQDYFVKDWAGNFVMHVLVDDLDGWWDHFKSLDLAGAYGVEPPRAPKLESWGLRVAYVFDPAGVLWHFAELPKKR